MEVSSYVLVICFVIAVFTFAILYFDKLQKVRTGAIILYYVALAGIVYAWFNLFFSDIFALVTQGKIFIACAATSFLCWGMVAFFSLALFKSKKKKNELINTISIAMLFFACFSAILFTFEYMSIKERERIETMHHDNLLNEVNCDLSQYELKTALVIPGASLCYTLGVTKEEALQIAKLSNLKYYYKGNKLIVVVHPGDQFIQICDIWILKSLLDK